MFTFLKGEYLEKASNEYRARLSILRLRLVILLLLIAIALSLPAFIMLGAKKSVALMDQASLAEVMAKSSNADVPEEMDRVNDMLEIIELNKDDVPVLTFLDRVLSQSGSGISISAISFERKSSMSAITTSGMADTRDDLVAFSKRLEAVPSLVNVKLPIQALAKSKDVPFNFSFDSKP